jgi:phage N-6-adenine-methyltransferase
MGEPMNVHFMSKTDLWATPRDVFDKLHTEFNFELDVCASPENAKCPRFYTKEIDGLSQQWASRNWMNPPYGRVITEWVKKASENPLTVCLLPARTDTRWFHNYILGKAEIRFLKGRLKFGDGKSPAPFPSMIVIFKEKAAPEGAAK